MEWRGVLVDGRARSSVRHESPIRSAISQWRVTLLDAAPATRLLDFNPAEPGSIEVDRPTATDVLARLRTGGGFAFRSLKTWAAATGAAPPPLPYLLDTDKDPDDLDAALRMLMRRSNTEWLERGHPVLYLTLGTLTWADRDRVRHSSPLLLVPVKLVATEPRQPPMVEPADDDAVVNPALSLELSRYRIVLPRVDDLPELTLAGLLDAVRAEVTNHGWLVSESAALSYFPAMKEPVYLDLLDHEDLITAHPMVKALTARGLPKARPALDDVFARHTVVREAPPLILPADSSQRACVMAVLAGRSFTIDGPPGTGKSQTIANMIGALLHAGKTVLLVSQKAAALDVAAERLAGAGLGGYLLELHSQKAARKQVAASLASALDPPAAAEALAGSAAAPGQREMLSAYADAVNRVRDPLGYSLHDVLSMTASLHAVPAAPPVGLTPAYLTVDVLGDIRALAADLAAAWRPAAQGPSFAWRGVTEQGALDDRLYQAASALETLARATGGNRAVATAAGLTRPSHAHTLARLLDHLVTWPESLPDEWLTLDTLDVVDAAVTQLTAILTGIAARETQAAQAAGMPWSQIPQRDALPAADMTALAALHPPCADVSDLAAGQMTEVAREFSAAADQLDDWYSALSGLAATLGLHAPVTFSDANDLLTLARLATGPDRPERAWLSVSGHRAAGNAAQVLYEAHRALAQAEAGAGPYFTPDALRQDVGGLARRFAYDHHGLGRLSAGYRADKRAVRAFTREGIPEETAEEHLALAVAWKRAARGLAAAEASHAPALGEYYAGRATDFTRLGRALSNAATAVRCARGQDLSRAADYISHGCAPDRIVSRIVAEARYGLSAWRAALAPAPALAPRPELLNGAITEAIGWLRAHLGPLRAASEFTSAVGEVCGTPLTFGRARELVALREAASSAHAELTARDAIFQDLCGQLYAGAATDVIALRDALEWARRLRMMTTGGAGPLTPGQLKAAESAIPTDCIGEAADTWHEACAALLAAFSPQRRPELAAELDDYQGGYDLLETMFKDTSGRAEWHAYQAARAALAAHGLEAAIDYCIEERIEASQVPRVLERALLHEWAEYQVRNDPALAPLRAVGRDDVAGRYRQLDNTLAAAAADDIVRACEARRPPSDTGESAVIRMEAVKKSKHLPVAELLKQARHLTQAIKPCFLMSPLAVSKYLPAGLRFDVVIADEASQISPADAVGCVYRGGALVLAGDDRQLPPPRGVDADVRSADPGSILDLAKASGAFQDFPLSWHYRSQHEALIAFSNDAFYGGRLISVPEGGRDSGVELFYGQGTYQRGTSRGNPDEAARVAQRVVHHFVTRPGLSLGVVTFSEAQAAAVEAALGSVRQQRPDLDRFFVTGRLHGFFVKNAESVQGDERDVIIVSLGYGPDERGQVTTDFGTLSQEGGWRRLNVAITRARFRTEIVTSVRASDIPESVTSEGLKQLRGYLGWAARSTTV